MRFYLALTCPSCDEEIIDGPILTLDEHNGCPLIMWNLAAQTSFDCEHCGKTCYSGEFELLTADQI